MDIIKVLEFFGMFLGILGAVFMSMSSRINTKPLLYAYFSFGLSNGFLLYVTSDAGLIFIYMQTIIFGLTGLKGIYTFGSLRLMLFFALMLFINIFASILMANETVLKVNYFELIFTVFAIVGTFFMANKEHNIREYAYILFFVADIGLVFIAIFHELYFFMTQTIVYLVTTFIAFYRNDGFLLNKIKGKFARINF